MTDPWKMQTEALGAFIRTQRKLADLSLRELAELTDVSNPYLSQLLNLSAETLLAQSGLLDAGRSQPDAETGESSVEAAIRTDATLSDDQKGALINLYRTMAPKRR